MGKDLGVASEQADVRCEPSHIAAKVLMKIQFAAGMCRFDLLRAVCGLVSKITKWTWACDAALHRLVSYSSTTLRLANVAHVRGRGAKLHLRLHV